MQYTPSLPATITSAVEGRLTGLHTMLPGQVIKVDVASGKCDVQPLIKRLKSDGTAVALPPINNCPIGFYRADKAAVYLPLKVGAYVEIRFCERSLDIWLTKGGTVDPKDARKHNLSDAVVYPGLYPFSNPPSDADPEKLVVVNDKAKLTLSPAGDFALTNDSATLDVTGAGKFKFQGASDELLTVLSDLLDKLIASKHLDPLTGEILVYDPAAVADLTAIKTRLTGLKE